jgi:signal peptidase I
MTSDNRKQLKRARELARGAHKLIRVHRDVLESRALEDLHREAMDLEAAAKARDIATVTTSGDKLEKLVEKHFPRPKNAGLRENVEALLVAVIVAMAVRTFFIQPFKIPTGSMQPTLYGIHPPPGTPPLPYDAGSPSVLDRLAGIFLQGKMYESQGYRSRGDFIFVDKVSYHFRKPHRGEVIVFDTGNLAELPASSRGKFYIKRLIGLENDTIQIKPPYVLVNGQVLDGQPAFQRIYSRQNGYNGYVIPETFPAPRYLHAPTDIYTVPSKHLFVLGDNSVSSLDGRFWGSLPKKDLVGRAVFIYWPFTPRFGAIS